MAIFSTACVHLSVLLVALRMTMAAPLDELTQSYLDEIFHAPEDYEEGHQYIPPSESSFDMFDWRLCQMLHKREPGSLVVSPISLKLVLAMVYEGAENHTAEELRSALNLPENRIESRHKYHRILEALAAKQPDLVMEVASKMFIRDDVTPFARYKRILQLFYNAELEKVDFSQSQAVQSMNSWVSKATHGHIKSMLDEGVVSSLTMILLLNAIYFKGLWKYPFNPNNTAIGNFQVTPTRSVAVPFMNMTQHLHFSESVQLDAKILRLPYKGRKYSMFIVLPNKPDGLDKLVKTVNPSLLRKHMYLMEDVKVNLALPKFNFEFTTELEDVLKEMGIRDMFDSSSASFPGIVKGRHVYVSKILQKAALDVNEEGTEAYVASGVTVDDRIGGGENVDFHAKHPFLFFIQDEKNGTVVFVGKLVDPTNSETPLTNSKHQNIPSKEYNLTPSLLGQDKSPGEDKQANNLNESTASKIEPEISPKLVSEENKPNQKHQPDLSKE